MLKLPKSCAADYIHAGRRRTCCPHARLSLLLLVLALCPQPAHPQDSAIEVLKGVDFDGPAYERADRLLRALALDQQQPELSSGQRHLLLKVLIADAMDVAIEDAPNERTERIKHIGMRLLAFQPSPASFEEANYEGEFDRYPILLTLVAAAHCQDDEYAFCRVLQEQVRTYLGVSFQDAALGAEVQKGIDYLDRWLRSVDPLGVGAYVTNSGLVQEWIGRVRARRQQGLEVELAYVRPAGPFAGKLGQTVEMPFVSIKPLTSLSLDALTKGFLSPREVSE